MEPPAEGEEAVIGKVKKYSNLKSIGGGSIWGHTLRFLTIFTFISKGSQSGKDSYKLVINNKDMFEIFLEFFWFFVPDKTMYVSV